MVGHSRRGEHETGSHTRSRGMMETTNQSPRNPATAVVATVVLVVSLAVPTPAAAQLDGTLYTHLV